jgi:hypothetical protein
MDFDAYKNTLPYPRDGDFKTTFWYKRGKMIAKRVGDGEIEYQDPFDTDAPPPDALNRECTRETDIDNEALKAARRKYNEETGRLTAQFRLDLFEDLGISDHPMRDKLYSKAWEDGHSAGLSEVYNVASDLVDLIAVPQGFVLVGKDMIKFGGICPSADAEAAARELAKEL